MNMKYGRHRVATHQIRDASVLCPVMVLHTICVFRQQH